jgi:hypothetical protein
MRRGAAMERGERQRFVKQNRRRELSEVRGDDLVRETGLEPA